MEWMKAISEAVDYIESHISDEITADDVANSVCISTFYFQKGFSMLCGYTIMEYIRNRRLALAGVALADSEAKVIDVAMQYGYDSPDSFTKAFTRFHGITPSQVRKDKTMIKSFAPLKLTISLKGGYLMDYRITKKDSFTVIGSAKEFSYEQAKQEIPAFWQEHYATGKGQHVCGMFGINIDEQMGHEKFEYVIADVYNPVTDIPEGFVTKTIPAFTWAVFPCKGAMPNSLQDVNTKIFSEWLPALKEYEFAAGYCIEMYDAPDKYPKGIQDENYYAEIWIPVKRK
ncbi:helix-turn-helix domain-containing protein [Acetobacterium fimetarium]|uniref:Helix-turn-helix domain-containing protein n=1 Tax=Acetobacterium fimetarium TaxID=52691 RepID=A0ABR6WXF5_9FIRM|nr:AraC family transcriptional regulator [Acetobacterium fimetarium]MBC3805245.1 helix-turn-helix domain-containing protein [Acetobacterium fimetarium]